MTVSSQWKRTIEKYKAFATSLLCSFIGLAFYLCGKFVIPFPGYWFGGSRLPNSPRLFLFGISVHTTVNFYLDWFFLLFSQAGKKFDSLKVRRWKYWANRVLVLVFTVIFTLGFYFQQPLMNHNHYWEDVILLGLVSVVINCCLIDLLIQGMNQYGVCNAYNLLFFVDYLPTKWITAKKWDLAKGGELLVCLALTSLFIYLTNLKWEMPIETNTLYNRDNKLARQRVAPFGFKSHLNFFPLYQLAMLFTAIYNAKIIFTHGSAPWHSQFFSKLGQWLMTGVQGENEIITASKIRTITQASGKSGWDFFFILNEEKKIFHPTIFRTGQFWSGQLLRALFFFLAFRFLFVWGWFSHQQWNAQEISKDLRNRGIYFDGIPPGRPTEKLLKKAINYLIIYWFILILLFNVAFDLTITDDSLTFLSWFSSVNTGTNLIQQIRTRYKYIQANN